MQTQQLAASAVQAGVLALPAQRAKYSKTAGARAAVEPAAKQPSKPKVHSSWAKLRRAFLASSHGPQQQQKRQQQQKLLGPQLTLKATGLRGSSDRAVGHLSPTALRYRKFVKGLKSSFSSFSAKNRRKALGEPACLQDLQHEQSLLEDDQIYQNTIATLSEPISSNISCPGMLRD